MRDDLVEALEDLDRLPVAALLEVELDAPELVDLVLKALELDDLVRRLELLGGRMARLAVLGLGRDLRIAEHPDQPATGPSTCALISSFERDLARLARALAGLVDVLGRVAAEQELLAQGVHGLALRVHHVVVLEQVLADVEVALLDLALRVLDAARDQRVLDGLVVGHAHAIHQVLDAIAGEDAHQVVFERQVELAVAGVALATGAAAQLVVDAARLVALRADDVEAAELDDLVVLLLAPTFSNFVTICANSSGSASGSLPCFFISRRAIISGLPPSKMSVPRPAMLVETVMAPLRPACATMYASFSWCLAFSTLCGIFFFARMRAMAALFSTLVVPTSIGRPASWWAMMSRVSALNFSRSVL